jgi:hypothetical protein
MSRALVRCLGTVVPVDSDHGIHSATIAALRRHDLIEEARDKRARRVWKPTTQGMRIIQTEPPKLLAARSQRGYTTEPAEALFDEPEAVDDKTANGFAKDSQERFKLLRGEEALHKETRSAIVTLRQEIVAATRAGVDVTPVLSYVHQAREHLALERRRTAA